LLAAFFLRKILHYFKGFFGIAFFLLCCFVTTSFGWAKSKSTGTERKKSSKKEKKQEKDPFSDLWMPTVLSQKRLRSLQTGTLPQLLEEQGGILLYQGMGGHRGVLFRGFTEKRLGARLDGVPLLAITSNGQTFSLLQTLPVSALSDIVFSREPSAVLYGNRALGGSLGLSTSSLSFTSNRWKNRVRLLGHYGGADQAHGGFTEWKLRHTHFAMSLNASYFRTLGLQVLEEPEKPLKALEGDAHQRMHASAKIAWRWNATWKSELYYLFSQFLAAQRKEPLWTPETTEDVQHRLHFVYLSLAGRLDWWKTRFRAVLSFQRREETIVTRRSQLGSKRLLWKESLFYPLQRVALTLNMVSWIWDTFVVRYGAELIDDRLLPESLGQEIFGGTQPDGLLTLEGNERSVALHFTAEARLLKSPFPIWVLMAGRVQPYNGSGRLKAPFSSQVTGGIQEWRDVENAVTFGIRMPIATGWRIRLLYTTGFRLPSLFERLQSGTNAGSFYLPVVQRSNEQSRSLSSELAFQVKERWSFSFRTFLQSIENWAFFEEAKHLGQTQVDGQSVLQMRSVSAMNFLGAEAFLRLKILPQWSVNASFNWQYPLESPALYPGFQWPPVPALGLLLRTQYRFGGWGSLECLVQMSSAQEMQVPVDPRIAKIPDKQALSFEGWVTVHLRGYLMINRYMRLMVMLENLLDQDYRRFRSWLPAPRRHIRISLEFLL